MTLDGLRLLLVVLSHANAIPPCFTMEGGIPCSQIARTLAEARERLSGGTNDGAIIWLGAMDVGDFGLATDFLADVAALAPTVVVTENDDIGWHERLLEAGAQEILTNWDGDHQTLSGALKRAIARHRCLKKLLREYGNTRGLVSESDERCPETCCRDGAASLARMCCGQDSEQIIDAVRQLTAREHKVLRLLVVGRGTKEIAHLSCRSPQTVRNQIASIRRKLRADSTPQLVAMVLSTGAIESSNS